MKNISKVFIITLITVMSLSFTFCDNGTTSSGYDTGTTVFGLPYDERVEDVYINPVYGNSNQTHYSLTVPHAEALEELIERLGPTTNDNIYNNIPNYTQRNSTTLTISKNINDSLQRERVTLWSYETRRGVAWIIVGNGNQIIRESGTVFNCGYSHKEIVTRNITTHLLTISFDQALAELINQFGRNYSNVAPPVNPNRYNHSQLSANNGGIQDYDQAFLAIDLNENSVIIWQGQGPAQRVAIWTNVSF